MPPQRRHSTRSRRYGGPSCPSATKLFRCCVSQTAPHPLELERTYKASKDCCRPVPTIKTSQAVSWRVSIVRAAEEKVRELGARKIGAERWFSAIADVMINRTKSARSCARGTSSRTQRTWGYLRHVRNAPGLHWSGEVPRKRESRPVSTALDFT